MGRSARNKANLKITQPLQSISLYADENLISSVLSNQDQILEELNIKKIEICKNKDDIVNFNLKPNYSTLAPKVGGNMKSVVNKLKTVEFDVIMDSLNSKGIYNVNIDKEVIEINKEDVIIDEIALENFSVCTNQNMVVGGSTLITPQLHNEGLIRDLIRYIQNLRKDSDLSVDDRINLVIKYNDESLDVALKDHQDYLLNEVLGVQMEDDINLMDYSNSFKINNKEIIVGIRVNSKK